ncbi:MAG: DMT family transporter, partial [Dehalococcoidia bacterium]|nr:DMT family transporter [Dehalococcoidia bacterium]
NVRPLGALFGLGSAFGYAFLVVLTKREAPSVDPLLIAALQTTVASVVLLPFVGLSGRLPVTLADAPLLLVLGVVHTAGALTLYYAGLKHVPAQTAGVVGFLEPVTAAALAALFLDEPITVATAVGAAMVVGSALLVRPSASASTTMKRA